MGQDSSKQGIGNDVLEQSEETKLQCVIKTSGDPSVLNGDSEVDGAEVQEKVKEVICKTITSIPLTADATSRERLSSDAGSATSKERLDSPSSISCIGEEGKLLVKVIKASGLCGKDKSGPISPYCIVSTSNPLQRKRTSMVRDNDSPFWNEYFTFDITPITKEVSLDIYDYEKTEKDCNGHMDDTELTEEQDDYLGQVIVPLSTVNRDQTCRLILPVLPKSSKSEHSKGDISLEFTFDKDGKVIDAALPVVSGFERNILPNDTEKPSAQSTPSEESPSVFVNGVESGVVNGHIPVCKRYIESSLDELAMEIEDYEQGGERPKPDAYCNGTQGEEDMPELHAEPELPPVVIATEAAAPSREMEQTEDESAEMAIVELLKLSGEEVPEDSKEEKKDTEHETRETQEEEEKEEMEETEQEGKEQKEKDDDEQVAKEHEEQTEEPSLKPKHRRSFNFRFKKKKTDKKAEKEEEEKVEERHEPAEETQEGDKKEETPVEDKEEMKETQEEEVHAQEGKEGEENETKEEEAEKIEHAAELEPKPKLRRSLFKRRPKSMAAADKKTDDDSEERVLSRHDPVRHSYHAGDLPALEPSNLRKSTSQSSLLSYSPNPYSTLVYETMSGGKKKYSRITPVMEKRKAYERGGNKLHIYNDHIFQAVHFTGSSPDCAVCGKLIKGKVGKQGYQCRGCKMVTHRDCHYETTAMCNSDAIKQMDIVKMPQFVGHK